MNFQYYDGKNKQLSRITTSNLTELANYQIVCNKSIIKYRRYIIVIF